MEIIELIFWISLAAILYTYIGYPFVLWILSFFKRKTPNVPLLNYQPKVSLLISAYNEEWIIRDKVINALSLEYPKDKLEIIVVSDASEDNTDKYVREFSTNGVRVIRQEERRGKTAALNLAVPETKGEIIIFSDANSFYDKKSISKLVSHFADPNIGLVSGSTKYFSAQGDRIMESANLYTRLERVTKRLESRLGSCVGADGAIFAIRKELY